METKDRKKMRESVRVALVGAGMGGLLSPALHEAEGRALGLDYQYELRDLGDDADDPDCVAEEVARARREGLQGMNVTHPCKRTIVDALDRLAPEAEELGAVNTVVLSGGEAVGHNTDIAGFREAFTDGLPGAAIGRVTVLGAGGAGAAVTYALLELGAGGVDPVDEDPGRADELAETLSDRFGASRVREAELGTCLPEADGLVHATPTGMGDDPESAVDTDLLRADLWVAEVVYVPLETPLLRDARAAGCSTMNGSRMVAAQAADSLELFTGVSPDRERVFAHIAELVEEREAVS